MDRADIWRRVEDHLLAAFGPETGRASVTFLGTEEIAVLRFAPPSPAGDGAGVTRYATVGMSATPMGDPARGVVDETAPRAELVLSLRAPRDSVARRLAVLAAIPAVEGIPVAPGAALELGESLWDGAPFTAVLVGDPGGLLPDLDLSAGPDSTDPVGPGRMATNRTDANRTDRDSTDPRRPGVGRTGTTRTGTDRTGGSGTGDNGTGRIALAPVRFLPIHPITAREAAFKRARGADELRRRWLAAGTDLRDPNRPEPALDR
jgi:hypothetical protein